MAKRKTVEVADLVHRVNNRLALEEEAVTVVVTGMTPEQAYRRALADLMADVLHQTSNYHGFAYQSSEFADYGVLREGYDDTRVRFYGS